MKKLLLSLFLPFLLIIKTSLIACTQVNIQNTNGGITTIKTDPRYGIDSVKFRIKEKKGIFIMYQKLFFCKKSF